MTPIARSASTLVVLLPNQTATAFPLLETSAALCDPEMGSGRSSFSVESQARTSRRVLLARRACYMIPATLQTNMHLIPFSKCIPSSTLDVLCEHKYQ